MRIILITEPVCDNNLITVLHCVFMTMSYVWFMVLEKIIKHTITIK